MNDYVHSSEDVERQFTAMMDTYLDSWIPADALPHMPRSGQQRAAVGSQLEIQALESQRHNLNSHANLGQHALALSSLTSPSGATDLDGGMFGLGLDVPNLELDAPAGQSSMLSAMSSGDATGTTGGNAPVPGTEGVRKQKILEKNRRAQKRFREKQKAKMADMEVALQDLQSTMSTVVKEKTCLKRQNEVSSSFFRTCHKCTRAMSGCCGCIQDEQRRSHSI